VTEAAPPAPPAPRAVLGTTGLNGACVDAAGATAGGAGCERPSAPVLHVGPPLPDNPTGINRIGVEGSHVDCTAIPTTPLTQCSSQGEDR
jgi:hypothetical protein